MISLYFGKPGSGKTTILTRLAVKQLKLIDNYNKASKVKKFFLIKPKYDYVCSNVDIKGTVKVNFDDLQHFSFSRCLILLDEITLDADSRDYKNFTKGHKKFFIMHRHYKNDINLYTQVYNRLDKTIRDIVDNCYYVQKILWITTILKIPTAIIIPKETGDIIQGYKLPTLINRLITTKYIWRPKYYKLFNSYYKIEDIKEYNYEQYKIN